MNIEEIRERHSKIGGTPWKSSDYSTDYYKQGYKVKTWNDADVAECIEELGEVDFIANAPSDIAYLLSIIEQVENAFINVRDRGMENAEDSEYVVIADDALKIINGS